MKLTRAAAGQLVWKEASALLPVWVACVAATALAIVPLRPYPAHVALLVAGFVRELATLAFPLGALTLGALSMSHEFEAHSAGVMVGLPVPRRATLLAKFATLAVALAVLGVVAYFGSVRVLFDPWPEFHGSSDALLLPLLCGLALAPAFTLWLGSPVGGAVLGAAVPIVFLLAGETIAQFAYGATNATLAKTIDLGHAMLWRGVPAACLLGLAWTVYAFDRHEWGSGPSAARRHRLSDVWHWGSPPIARDHSVSVRRSSRPYLRLLLKDLTLQTPTLVVLLGYLAAWTLSFTLHLWRPLIGIDPDVMGVMFATLIALLAGAMAFAPERALGTDLLNRMQPRPALSQWAIKTGLAFALALAGVAVVGLLAPRDLPPSTIANLWPRSYSALQGENLMLLATCVGLTTAVSLHASSFASTGPRAVLLSIVSVFGAYTWYIFIGLPVADWLHRDVLMHLSRQPEMRAEVGARMAHWLTDTERPREAALVVIAAVVAAIPLRLSYLNFTRADQPAWPWRQVIAISATASTVVLLVSIGIALLRFL